MMISTLWKYSSLSVLKMDYSTSRGILVDELDFHTSSQMEGRKTLTYVGKLPSNIIKLLPFEFEDLKRFWGFEKELNKLRESLDAIADLVEDAEENRVTDVLARQWLTDVKEVCYEADNLLSKLAYETTRLQIHNQEVHNISITRAIDNVRKAEFRLRMRTKLKKVCHSLEKIQRESLSLQLTSIQHNIGDIMLPTDSILDIPIVGRRADVAKIVNLLTSSCYQPLTVVSIEGGAGIGKTAVAKLVRQKVMGLARKPFDVTIWVYVCGELNVHKLLGEMLKSLNESMGGLSSEDAMLQQLQKELVSKKFLLVLDNVWHFDEYDWLDVLTTLMSKITTNKGNGVLVTTREESGPALLEGASLHSYTLKSLSDDECWFIMKERAFRNVITPIPSNLQAIGRDIAEKCRGIPLFANVLGAVMGFNRDRVSWLIIRDDNIFKLSCADAVLALGFDHLPSYVKSCFSFCSIFPKDVLIRKEELIWLWMTEGIVESHGMGNRCFDALFQDAEKDNDGEVILCKMHDLESYVFRRLTKLSSIIDETSSIYHLYVGDQFAHVGINNRKDGVKKLRTVMVGGAPNQEIWKMKKLRSLHLSGAEMEELPSSIGKMQYLRYLDVSISETKRFESSTRLYNLQTLNLSNSKIKELPDLITKLFYLKTLNLSNSYLKQLPESISKLHNLQTLNVSNSNIKKLPESITKLYNLETLDVSKSNIKELPESISELYNLQTLKFLECKKLTKLPRKKICNLINLKHIAFSYEHQMPYGLGKLKALETLQFFVLGSDWGGSIQELEYLNELRGELKITRLEEVGDKKEVERANLRAKAKIQGLGFEWSCGANDRSSWDEELLEGLQSHPNVKRIKIKYYMGEKLPSWMLRIKRPSYSNCSVVLNNLVDLRLERCYNCVQLPCLGNLRRLKLLKMNHMAKVKCMNDGFYGIDSEHSSNGYLRLFPALKSLSISWMENLIEWSSPSDGNKVVVFPCLENLCIQSCANLTSFPIHDLTELEKLEIRDCEELRFLTGKQQSFPFLSSLSIVGCSKLTNLRNWLQSDMCFMELSVKRCKWLTFISEDLGKVRCLTSLEIYFCKSLIYFPGEILSKLTRLQNLSIGAFSEELDDFCYLNQIKDLPCLKELEIWGSDFFGREMCSLPNQCQHLTVLKSLKVMGFTAMEALPEWLTNLQSLQSLSLDYCRNLGCQSTTTILQRLPNLTHLNISCCPILGESKSEWLQSMDTIRIKAEFSHVSKFGLRL